MTQKLTAADWRDWKGLEAYNKDTGERLDIEPFSLDEWPDAVGQYWIKTVFKPRSYAFNRDGTSPNHPWIIRKKIDLTTAAKAVLAAASEDVPQWLLDMANPVDPAVVKTRELVGEMFGGFGRTFARSGLYDNLPAFQKILDLVRRDTENGND